MNSLPSNAQSQPSLFDRIESPAVSRLIRHEYAHWVFIPLPKKDNEKA